MSQVQIAETFMPSADRLTKAEQGHVLGIFRELLHDPASPGLSLERISNSKDPNVWSARVTRDIRLVLWRKGPLNMLLYTGHHDDAYRWAERHRIDTDRFSGALQLVNLPTVTAGPDPSPAGRQRPSVSSVYSAPHAPFSHLDQAALRSYGVPDEWVPFVQHAISLDDFADNIAHQLPPDVAERLIALGLGEFPIGGVSPPANLVAEPRVVYSDSAEEPYPAAGHQFYPISDLDEVNRLLAHPFAAWLAFLHPDQRRLAERSFNGPVKVTGSAGTGKTVLALHRARNLARRGKSVLLTTYTNSLCRSLERQIDMLCTPDERRRIQIMTVHGAAADLVRAAGERVTRISNDDAARQISAAWHEGLPLSRRELAAEWEAVIAANGISTWDDYRVISRAGRGRPLSATQRKLIWDAMGPVLTRWRQQRRLPFPDICAFARDLMHRDQTVARRAIGGIDSVIVDEYQDLGPQELRLLAAIAGVQPRNPVSQVVASLTGGNQDRLFLTGDAGQRIYQRRSTLASAGIDVRGRSFTLRVNYRTTAQIRRFADRILPELIDEGDGDVTSRRFVRSVMSGTQPETAACAGAAQEIDAIVAEIETCRRAGCALDEIAIFARTNARAEQLRGALRQRRIPTHDPNAGDARSGSPDAGAPGVTVTTLHHAKGLEYKVVIVAGASGDVLPLPAALQDAADPSDQEDVHQRERQLLYVGLTRARDRLLVTWIGEPSAYLEDALTTPGLSGPPA